MERAGLTRHAPRGVGGIRRFALVAGPGLIVMMADNDAGAVATYTQAGADCGDALLWLLPVLLPFAYVVQEMVARLGVGTGHGLAALIRLRFGPGPSRAALAGLLVVNALTLVTEFAAIALIAGPLGLPPALLTGLAAIGLVLAVASGGYRRWEALTLLLCLLNAAWLYLAWRLSPGTAPLLRALLPAAPPGGATASYGWLLAALVGTTVAPWQLFFQQSCIAAKRPRLGDLRLVRLDTLIGVGALILMAACMMVAGAAMHRGGIAYRDPAQMATALVAAIGPAGRLCLLLLMANAALLGAMAVSLCSAWACGEVFGWRHGLGAHIRDAPAFYGCYVITVLSAAAAVLLPGMPLQKFTIAVQVLSGVLLSPVLLVVYRLLNDRALLADGFSNPPWRNAVALVVICGLSALAVLVAWQALLPG